MLGRKIWNATELQNFFFAECITDLYGAVVVNADNVPGKGFFHIFPFPGHKNGGVGQSDLFSGTVVDHFHTSVKFAGAYPYKRDAVPVGRIHVGLDFKSKT